MERITALQHYSKLQQTPMLALSHNRLLPTNSTYSAIASNFFTIPETGSTIANTFFTIAGTGSTIAGNFFSITRTYFIIAANTQHLHGMHPATLFLFTFVVSSCNLTLMGIFSI
ncbi:hypothetical protein Pelo_17375 [Pelomyxa schiedti]|nr:hypothetical protein Pelo_17375 [Pelomyxa schiedti]